MANNSSASNVVIYAVVIAIAAAVSVISVRLLPVTGPDSAGLSAAQTAAIEKAVADQIAKQSTPVSGGQAGAGTTGDRAKIEAIVKDYLLKNPAVLRDSLLAMERLQKEQERLAASKSIIENADAVFRSEHDYVAGNPDGKVTMVEFFDYNCSFCKRAMNDVLKLMETDKDLRMVMKEFPILGPGSVYAARAALASKKQDKYWDFHLAMLKSKGALNQAKVDAIATSIGIDVDKLKADMDAPEVAKAIGEAHALADKMGIRGTPAFVIADQLIPGALGYEALRQRIASVRENPTCKVC